VTPLALTTGEPAGIGPDLALQFASQDRQIPLVALGNRQLFATRAAQLGLDVTLHDWHQNATAHCQANHLSIIDLPLAEPVIAGSLNPNNSQYVIDQLTLAHNLVSDGLASAIVTAPVQKSIINDAGIVFSGHTEFFAQRAKVDRVVMMLATGDFRVALATTHIPLRDIADAITQPLLHEVIHIINHALITQFGIAKPRILVCGLNPHAGENGHLGHEEIDTIIPALNSLRVQGMELIGPLPADTAMTPANITKGDVVLAMYHDQGLPTLKHAGFGNAVNITLGLGYIRTSVDHGTALDLAGSGNADCGSLYAAIECAAKLVAKSC